MLIRHAALCALLLLAQPGSVRAAEPGPQFGALNVHWVLIEAPPARVWALLFDRAQWMEGFAYKTVIDGTARETGERARFTGRGAGGDKLNVRLEEILLADPPRRLVTRLATADDTATHSFVDFRLTPSGKGGTRLEFDMFWLDRGEPGADWAAVQKTRAAYAAITGQAIEGHLRRIKAAAEAGVWK